MRANYTYETTRAAILRLGMGPVWEMAIEEGAQRELRQFWVDAGSPPEMAGALAALEAAADEDRARAGDRAVDYEDAADWWEAHGWDLLLDYDRIQDVPGAIVGKPFWTAPGGSGTRVIEVDRHPPDMNKLRLILASRLERAGYGIVGWEALASTNGWHVKVRLHPSPASPIETVALQAMCGSDPLRESCNIERARAVQHWLVDADRAHPEAADFWRKRWNVLYEANPERVKI